MKIVRVFTTLGVLAAGVAGFTALKNSRQVAHKVPPAQRGVLVEVMEARPAPQAIEVIAQGTVMAAQEVSLVPQVSGVVLDQHPGLVPGVGDIDTSVYGWTGPVAKITVAPKS